MSESDLSHRHHTIDYVEIYVSDMAQAKAFYTAAFSWSFNDYGPGYAGIVRGGSKLSGQPVESGGLCLVDKLCSIDSERCPLIVLYSDDIELSLRSVTKAGGTIVKEIFEFPGGKRFQFRDPHGTELAVWTRV